MESFNLGPYTACVGKVSDQAYWDFVFHPFAIRFSSSAEEQYPGFALSALFLFQPEALMSLRHCDFSLVERMLYGLSNILRETRDGRQESKTADQEGAALDLSDEMAQTW
jgi:hypothetical protein